MVVVVGAVELMEVPAVVMVRAVEPMMVPRIVEPAVVV